MLLPGCFARSCFGVPRGEYSALLMQGAQHDLPKLGWRRRCWVGFSHGLEVPGVQLKKKIPVCSSNIGKAFPRSHLLHISGVYCLCFQLSSYCQR